MKTLIVSVLNIVLIFVMVGNVSAFSGSGSGTEADPYIITNVNELQEMKDGLNAWYKLAKDIDASDTVNWSSGAGFLPVGDPAHSFAGHLEGDGRIISNLYINRSATDYVGLFGKINGATIKNLHLADPNVLGKGCTGGLVGCSSSASTSNCNSAGTVYGFEEAGGFVGRTTGNSTITDCYSTGRVNGTSYVGGFIGYHQSGSVSKSFSTADSNASGYDCGGFVGLSKASITDCFATGAVSGWEYIGGFAGETSAATTNCYSAGPVSGSKNTGGFVGYNSGTCNACFWDTATSGLGISGCGTGKATAEMMQRATFDPPWNFATIWGLMKARHIRT